MLAASCIDKYDIMDCKIAGDACLSSVGDDYVLGTGRYILVAVDFL